MGETAPMILIISYCSWQFSDYKVILEQEQFCQMVRLMTFVLDIFVQEQKWQ